MTRDEIQLAVVEAIKKVTMKSDLVINADTDLKNDIGLDSLDTVELLMDLEDNHDVVITNEEAETFRTLEDVVTMVEQKLELKKDI
jgi:acyl carrier protein